jgi:hypothetical protein
MGKQSKKNPPKQDELDFFIVDTFSYEVEMVRETHKLLCQADLLSTAFPDNKQIVRTLTNALIESFCVHARNIIVFLRRREKNMDFLPKYFTKSYNPPDKDFINASLLSALNDQITHLSVKRTNNNTKIGHADREVIVAAIEDEIERFHDSLTKHFGDKWVIGPRYEKYIPNVMDLGVVMANATGIFTGQMLSIPAIQGPRRSD